MNRPTGSVTTCGTKLTATDSGSKLSGISGSDLKMNELMRIVHTIMATADSTDTIIIGIIGIIKCKS